MSREEKCTDLYLAAQNNDKEVVEWLCEKKTATLMKKMELVAPRCGPRRAWAIKT